MTVLRSTEIAAPEVKPGKVNRALKALLAVVLLIILVLAVEVLHALYGFGPAVPFNNPSREPVTLGSGPPLKLLVLGDSTAAGQGAPYADGIAMGAAGFLAQRHRVTLVNLAVSGATVNDVLVAQVPAALRLQPDVVLISAGANDVTHFTSSATLSTDTGRMLGLLSRVCPPRRIVVLGSPDLGATPRFAQPLRWVAGTQTRRVNRLWNQAVRRSGATWAPVVTTGPQFAADGSLSAADRFHPSARGYATWLPVIDRGLTRTEPIQASPRNSGAG